MSKGTLGVVKECQRAHVRAAKGTVPFVEVPQRTLPPTQGVRR